MAKAAIKARTHTENVVLEVYDDVNQIAVTFTVSEWSQVILTGKTVKCKMLVSQPNTPKGFLA